MPRTTVFGGAVGVMVTVIVPLCPGASRNGCSDDPCQLPTHGLPVLEFTATSNLAVTASALVDAVIFGAEPVRAPISVAAPTQIPAGTSGALNWASDDLRPDELSTYGEPSNHGDRSPVLPVPLEYGSLPMLTPLSPTSSLDIAAFEFTAAAAN